MTCQKDIRYFCLHGLLPDQHVLAFNPALGSLCWLAPPTDGVPMPQLLAEQLFTQTERTLLLPILEVHPLFCPYEVLLAHFTSRTVTPEVIERCRQQLGRARWKGKGQWDFEIRPVRNVMSRTRLKMHAFGMTILSLLETGYLLRPLPPTDPSRE